MGSNVQNLSEKQRAQLDPELRNEDASMAFLREHLLAKGAKKQKSTTSTNPLSTSLYGIDPTFRPNQKDTLQVGTTAYTEAESHAKNTKTASIEDDGEDEVGRSGIGGQKSSENSKKPKPGPRKKLSAKQKSEDDQDSAQHQNSATIAVGDGKTAATASREDLDIRPKSKKKATSYLDELLAQKKKRKG